MRRNPRQSQPFWSRRKQPQEPVIVVNGVTYGSPDEIPADLRAVWDKNVRQLEQRGLDWREQRRIVLTWSHAGNVVRQNFSIEGKPRHLKSERWTLLGAAFLGFIIGWVVLAVCGLGWKDPPLVFGFDGSLLRFLFGFFYVPWVLMAVNLFRKRQLESESLKSEREDFLANVHKRSNLFIDPDTPIWNLAGAALVALAGTFLVTYYAVFGGAAKFLHYTERKSGEATAAIAGKYSYSSKNARCVPRIKFEGFRHVGNELCVDREFFDLVKVGDRVRITGTISRYAIEPERLEVVAPLEGKDT